MLKVIRTIWAIIRAILTVVLVALLVVVVTQRVSNNKMAVAGFRIFTVVTESMTPKYVVGDAIVTKTIEPSEIKIGDDITYLGMAESFKDKIVTHRVINISEEGMETKGDKNDSSDGFSTTEENYIGKNIFSIPGVGYLVKNIQTRRGKIILGTLIVFFLLSGFFMSDKTGKRERVKGRRVKEKS